jgi:hypothetical protein
MDLTLNNSNHYQAHKKKDSLPQSDQFNVHDSHVEQPHVPAEALHAHGIYPEQLQQLPGTQQKTPFLTLINLMCIMAMWNNPMHLQNHSMHMDLTWNNSNH